MAEAGLRYNRFHVTALCSPSRAALLTGRNHHTVGFGSIGELGVVVYHQEASEPLPTGEVTVQLVFAADAANPVRFSGYSGMDIGRDNGLPVDRRYADQSPFAFTGTIRKVVFDINPHPAETDEQALHEHAHQSLTAHGMST